MVTWDEKRAPIQTNGSEANEIDFVLNSFRYPLDKIFRKLRPIYSHECQICEELTYFVYRVRLGIKIILCIACLKKKLGCTTRPINRQPNFEKISFHPYKYFFLLILTFYYFTSPQQNFKHDL
jgi:hypothetical protein